MKAFKCDLCEEYFDNDPLQVEQGIIKGPITCNEYDFVKKMKREIDACENCFNNYKDTDNRKLLKDGVITSFCIDRRKIIGKKKLTDWGK